MTSKIFGKIPYYDSKWIKHLDENKRYAYFDSE